MITEAVHHTNTQFRQPVRYAYQRMKILMAHFLITQLSK
jgi:hypothetical protein